MTSNIPRFPEPVDQVVEYASDFDKAERALPTVTSPRTSKSATFETSYTEKELLPERPSSSFNTSSLQKPSVLSWLLSATTNLWPAYKEKRRQKEELYSVFQDDKVEDHPAGFPQLAAFINSSSNFAIFRKFGRTNCRLLLHLQSEISALEKELADLDREDAIPGSPTSYRLISSKYEDGWDIRQREILRELQERVVVYYDLLLKDNQLRAIGRPLKRNHRSVFHWIVSKKPLSEGEDDWIQHTDDLVPLATIDRFESSISSSWLNRLFAPSRQDEGHITYYSGARLSFTAKLFSTLLSVSILIIPILVLFWSSMSRVWMSATLLISMFLFSTLLCAFSNVRLQEVLLGSAAYCAVLATFLGNSQLPHP